MLIKFDFSLELHGFDILLMSLAAALIGHLYGFIDLSRLHCDFVKFLRCFSKDDDIFDVSPGWLLYFIYSFLLMMDL